MMTYEHGVGIFLSLPLFFACVFLMDGFELLLLLCSPWDGVGSCSSGFGASLHGVFAGIGVEGKELGWVEKK